MAGPGTFRQTRTPVVNTDSAATRITSNAGPQVNGGPVSLPSGASVPLPATIVSSVGLSMTTAVFTVTGSPVTASGTLTVTLHTQAANLVWAGPTTGAAAAPSFRSLIMADLPAGIPQTLFAHFADVGNSGTSETDLYSDTIAAGQLAANGNSLAAIYGLNIVLSATATRQLKVYFGGTAIFDSTALAFATTGVVELRVTVMRDSATTIRYCVTMTDTGAPAGNYMAVGKLTGLTLSGTNILKITGQSAGTGAASNDIVATLGRVVFHP